MEMMSRSAAALNELYIQSREWNCENVSIVIDRCTVRSRFRYAASVDNTQPISRHQQAAPVRIADGHITSAAIIFVITMHHGHRQQ